MREIRTKIAIAIPIGPRRDLIISSLLLAHMVTAAVRTGRLVGDCVISGVRSLGHFIQVLDGVPFHREGEQLIGTPGPLTPLHVAEYCSLRFRAPAWADVEPPTMEGVPYENRHCARRSRLRPLGRVPTLASRPMLRPASPQTDNRTRAFACLCDCAWRRSCRLRSGMPPAASAHHTRETNVQSL